MLTQNLEEPISDMIEMSDVNHVNILFSIAVQMMSEAETQNLTIKDSIIAILGAMRYNGKQIDK
jgi:hypothetical protein